MGYIKTYRCSLQLRSFLLCFFLGVFPLLSFAQRTILPIAENLKDTGIASYYHTKFNGWPTSSGEAFSNKKMTAASNSLPLDTYVRVTNLKNGKWVIVRINDRMHKRNKRIIDLTYAAAKKLGMIYWGIVKVEVAVIPKAFYYFFGLKPGIELKE